MWCESFKPFGHGVKDVRLLVCFLGHKRNKEQGSCTWNNFPNLKDGKNAKEGEAIKNLSIMLNRGR